MHTLHWSLQLLAAVVAEMQFFWGINVEFGSFWGTFFVIQICVSFRKCCYHSSQASDVTPVASGTCFSVPHWVPMVLQLQGEIPAWPFPWLHFILSKAMLPAPSQLPDVRQKGQLCFGLNTSHLVFIFSKRFKEACNKTPGLRKKPVGTAWHQPSDISTSSLFSTIVLDLCISSVVPFFKNNSSWEQNFTDEIF